MARSLDTRWGRAGGGAVVGLLGAILAGSIGAPGEVASGAAPTEPGPDAVEEPLRLVRAASPDIESLRLQLAAEGVDIACGTKVVGDGIEFVVSGPELTRLRGRGFALDEIARGRPLRDILAEQAALDGLIPPGYLDLTGILDEMTLAAATYPTICELVDLTATYGTPPTFEGRHLYAVRISDNVAMDEDEPTALFVSCHHSREIITPVIGLEAIDRLTTGYGVDPALTALVDEYEIWIAPVWNPDGYEHVFNSDNLWRKNRHVFPQGVGVDLNRNYPFGWDSPCSGSTNVNTETYRGTAAASEPETQTMVALANDRHFAKVFDYHSFSNEVRYGYGCWNHPLLSFLISEASDLAATIPGYGTASSCCTAGNIHFHSANKGTHAFLWETYSEWQPPFVEAEAEAARLFAGIVVSLERPISVSGHVTDAATGAPVDAVIDNLDLVWENGEINTNGGPFGRYHTTLPPGQYRLEFSADGYVPEVRTVDITGGSAELLDVALARPLLAISFPGGLPSLLDPAGDVLDVEITELEPNSLVPGSPTLHYAIGGGAFQTTPLVPLGGDLYQAIFPSFDCGEDVAFYVSVEDVLGLTLTSPPGAPASLYEALVAVAQVVVFTDDFETNQGWSVENLGATSGDWERGVPVNDPGWAHDPVSDGDGSGQCFLTENAPGNTDVDGGAVRLTSPLLDLSGGGATIEYYYYLRLTNANGIDRLLVEVSSAGPAGPWTVVATHDTDGGLDWRLHTITQADLNAAGVPPTTTTVLRFTVNDDEPQSIVESGVDGVRVTTVSCGGPCPADVNGDETVDVLDLLAVLTAWGPCPACPEDITGDGTVDVLDLLEVLTAWGPCP